MIRFHRDLDLMKRLSAFALALALGAWLPAAAADPVKPWAPAGISSGKFESHAAFDPKTGDLYFVRSSPQFAGWRIFVSRCTQAGWSEPQSPSFAGDGVEADPFFTADGRSLYFISSRAVEGVKQKNLDIWKIDRDEAGSWKAPVHLPVPVNSSGAEWFPRPGAGGWLYFGSDRPGGSGATDLYRARADAAGQWTVENLGAAVNAAGDEYEPLPAPDGSRMIFMADGDLYETRETAQGWALRTKLGPEINSGGLEVGPLFSPSGRSLLFARDTQGPASGEFFVWYEHGPEAWPPDCPAAGAAASTAEAPPLKLSHAWIVVKTGAPERTALEKAGFRIAPTVNRHEGQGTASISVELLNGFLELMYPDPDVPVSPGKEAGAEKFRKKSRWRETGLSPIGIVFDRTPATPEKLPFPTWRVTADWMDKGTFIEMMTPKENLKAVSLSISSHKESTHEKENVALARDPAKGAMFLHPNGARRLTGMRVVAPDADGLPPAASYLGENGLMKFEVGGEWLLDVTLDDGAQKVTQDLRPDLPLVVHY